MAKVYHPTFSEVSYDVASKDVKKWTVCGWLTKPVEEPQATTEPEDDGKPADEQ